MDPRLLQYYNDELRYIREMGSEFAHAYPKIAGRLGLEGIECADPYVERLLESFSFVAARVQLKLDSEFPIFTQHLLEVVYPNYLAQMPSMAVVQFQPDFNESSLRDGVPIARGSSMRSRVGKQDQTACEYRTAHSLSLWPIEVADAAYQAHRAALSTMGIPVPRGTDVKAFLRLRLHCGGGATFDKLSLDELPIFVNGTDGLPDKIIEQVLAHQAGVVIRAVGNDMLAPIVLDNTHITRVGYEDDEAMLPLSARNFSGYRLLQEYFAFPVRYQFFGLRDLNATLRRMACTEVDIFILLKRGDSALEKFISSENFLLYCTPAVNLFPKRLDRLHLDSKQTEYHLVPDRTRALDYEVYSVSEVEGFGAKADLQQTFKPFYASNNATQHELQNAYFTVQRRPRLISEKQSLNGRRSSYEGTETFIVLVDGNEAPYRSELRQIGVKALCTNRDLPMFMPLGQGDSDFTLESGAPVKAIRCVAGPSKPRPSRVVGDTAWRLISHLSTNFLTLVDSDQVKGAAALRELLKLYSDQAEPHLARQMDGVHSIRSRGVTRRLPVGGPASFGRGLEITVTCEEATFAGTGVFLLGAVLEEFFSRYVSINGFTETILTTAERGEVMRWPLRTGRQQLI